MNKIPGIPSPTTGITTTATPAPLHDIVGPLFFFPYTLREVLFTIALLLLISGGLFLLIRKLRQKPPLTPQKATLKALTEMKERIMEGNDHQFGVLVSGFLREYLGTVFLLAAPRQTTEEFLTSLRENNSFTSTEQDSLGHFLNTSDLLKFANGEATEEERLALIVAAEHFVKSGTTERKDHSEEAP